MCKWTHAHHNNDKHNIHVYMIYKTTAIVVIRSIQYTIVGGNVDDLIYYFFSIR